MCTFSGVLAIFLHGTVLGFAAGDLQDQYIGCFSDPEGQSNWTPGLPSSDNLTIEICISSCKAYNTTYSSLQNGNECRCCDTFRTNLLNDSICNVPCSGNELQYCGGLSSGIPFSAFYAVCPIGYYGSNCDAVCHCAGQIPCNLISGQCPNGCDGTWTGSTCDVENSVSGRYVGCYGDTDQDRALIYPQPQDDQSNTIEKCSFLCAMNEPTKGSTYLGGQYSSFCFCGETYDKHGKKPEVECNMPCSGNQSQMCGGSFRNNVYSVCANGTFGRDCVDHCYCKDSSRCTFTGSCPSECKPGWTGNNCNVRDCSVEYGDCSGNLTCINIDLKYSLVTRCRCPNGYGTNLLWADVCTDVDECVLTPNVCYEDTETCSNTIGSFNCLCLPGFQRINEATPCQDINECLLDTCDNSTTSCNNTFGDFECRCLEGFESLNKTTRPMSCVLKPTTPSNDNGAAIAGAVVGCILGVILIILLVFLILRHNRKKRKGDDDSLYEIPGDRTHENQFSDQLVRTNAKSLYVPGKDLPNVANAIIKKLSDKGAMEKEFQGVPMNTQQFCELGTREELKKKNRFQNIIPYEWNRVVLPRNSDDPFTEYVNASYVQGYQKQDKFIASQAPRKESVDDFWRMIVEKEVPLIVMITNLIENQKVKCEKYWPDKREKMVLGDITVTLAEENSWPDYTVRRLKASKDTVTIDVKQFQYHAWPDHGTPTDVKGFLHFHQVVRHLIKPDNYTLVHCSAGAGRTGAFIAIDYLLEQEKAERDVDIHGCLKQLREQRSSMIQNLKQYEFVHRAVLKALVIGNTAVPVSTFISRYQSWQQMDEKTGKTTIEAHFQDLVETNSNPEDSGMYRAWSSLIEDAQMARMDAVYINSWKRKDAYLSIKILDSVTDIWNLREEKKVDCVVFLENSQNRRFLPTKEMPVALKNSSLFLQSEFTEDYGFRCLIGDSMPETYENAPGNSMHETYANAAETSGIYENIRASTANTRTTVLRVTKSLEKEREHLEHVFSLFDAVDNLRLSGARSGTPVMIVSSDSSLSGLCVALFNAIEMMKQEQQVDLYQIVLNIRKSKPALFSSPSSYKDLHDAVERYIRTSTT